jgi:hypothetical protein
VKESYLLRTGISPSTVSLREELNSLLTSHKVSGVKRPQHVHWIRDTRLIQPTPAPWVAGLTDGRTNGATTSASIGRNSEPRSISAEATANTRCISTETLEWKPQRSKYTYVRVSLELCKYSPQLALKPLKYKMRRRPQQNYICPHDTHASF